MKNTGYKLMTMRTPFGDCTNGGVSANTVWVNVVGRVDGVLVEPISAQLRNCGEHSNYPLVAVKRVGGHDVLVPVEPFEDYFVPSLPDGAVGPMHGGNVATADPDSDAGFVQWLTGAPCRFGLYLNIHDRFETPEDYDALSR